MGPAGLAFKTKRQIIGWRGEGNKDGHLRSFALAEERCLGGGLNLVNVERRRCKARERRIFGQERVVNVYARCASRFMQGTMAALFGSPGMLVQLSPTANQSECVLNVRGSGDRELVVLPADVNARIPEQGAWFEAERDGAHWRIQRFVASLAVENGAPCYGPRAGQRAALYVIEGDLAAAS